MRLPTIFSLFNPNILLSTLFSNIVVLFESRYFHVLGYKVDNIPGCEAK